MILKHIYKGNRYFLWPIWFTTGSICEPTFTWHAWQVDFEMSDVTGDGCMPGIRKVFGQTLHFCKLKLCFGPRR